MNKRTHSKAFLPILRMRTMFMVLIGLCILIAGPMLAVWKQVYINSASVRISKLNDSLATVNKEIASSKIACEKLSNTERIESFAREALQLEYPVSSQIVIVEVGKKSGSISNFFDKYFRPTKRTMQAKG